MCTFLTVETKYGLLTFEIVLPNACQINGFSKIAMKISSHTSRLALGEITDASPSGWKGNATEFPMTLLRLYAPRVD